MSFKGLMDKISGKSYDTVDCKLGLQTTTDKASLEKQLSELFAGTDGFQRATVTAVNDLEADCKLDFDQKTITDAEAKSTLTLEEAITRWVGMDIIKSKFNAHNITGCTVVQTEPTPENEKDSKDSKKSSPQSSVKEAPIAEEATIQATLVEQETPADPKPAEEETKKEEQVEAVRVDTPPPSVDETKVEDAALEVVKAAIEDAVKETTEDDKSEAKDGPILSKTAPESVTDATDGATESPKSKSFLKSDWFSCFGGGMQKSETIESQPSVIKNDLSDDVEQDAAPVDEAPQLVNAEAPSDETVEKADEMLDEVKAKVEEAPEATEEVLEAVKTEVEETKAVVEKAAESKTSQVEEAPETVEGVVEAVKAEVEETNAGAKDALKSKTAEVEESKEAVEETVEAVKEKVQKPKKSSIFSCFSKPVTKDDEDIAEKPVVPEEKAPIDLTEKDENAVDQAEEAVENAKAEANKAVSQKLPEIVEETKEAVENEAKTNPNDSLAISKPTKSE